MDKYLEAYNYKYNAWLPVDIIDKLSEDIVKVRYYLVKTIKNSKGELENVNETFETCTFWKNVRTIKI